ncbi:hypothetical protein QQ020_12725 [Fulvivirgaceae bacterium BMA12]|uniref:Lipoprotein n=1 Tax=Agaribacillus aureus TaxID=3051825 RepID=A0ABT8L5A3_9BACT|nr:hypothetical protein [Fulvivirgaceae bacterium BMA12]
MHPPGIKKSFALKLLAIAVAIASCQKEGDKDIPAGIDTGTKLLIEEYILPESETKTYPAGYEIVADNGMRIDGDIVCDGDFTLTSSNGDIVIGGKITHLDQPKVNGDKSGRISLRTAAEKADDGFSRTITAQNGNIILRKGATIFSGRGQHATTESLSNYAGLYEGKGGGNGGLIILNAPQGKIILPDLGDTVVRFRDEVFVLGNGGNGAGVEIIPNLVNGEAGIVEVRGGLGGNSGKLIIDAQEIVGLPSPQDMENQPDYIYGGEGGHGGHVSWKNAGVDIEYSNLVKVLFHGGDGGEGAVLGGYGGYVEFSSAFESSIKIGKPMPLVNGYGGHGGDVFGSPIPLTEVQAGNGGEYTVDGFPGWDGGVDENGDIYRDGGIGGSVVGQGGNGGDIQQDVMAFLGFAGEGGNSDQSRETWPELLGRDLTFLSSAFGVVGGEGGKGYSDCEGCPGGNGGGNGGATAIGGDGGSVLGNVIMGYGGNGGDTWAVLYRAPGNGGDGNPAGLGGNCVLPVEPSPGKGGSGNSFNGEDGEHLGAALGNNYTVFDGALCGEDLECEDQGEDPTISCLAVDAQATYYHKQLYAISEDRALYSELTVYQTVLERNQINTSPSKFHYTISGVLYGRERDGEGRPIATSVNFSGPDDSPDFKEYNSMIRGVMRQASRMDCSGEGTLLLPGDYNVINCPHIEGTVCEEFQVTGCLSFLTEDVTIQPGTHCCIPPGHSDYTVCSGG